MKNDSLQRSSKTIEKKCCFGNHFKSFASVSLFVYYTYFIHLPLDVNKSLCLGLSMK